MKIYTTAYFNMSEWQVSFQYEETGFSEARSFQDKQKCMIGRGTLRVV